MHAIKQYEPTRARATNHVGRNFPLRPRDSKPLLPYGALNRFINFHLELIMKIIENRDNNNENTFVSTLNLTTTPVLQIQRNILLFNVRALDSITNTNSIRCLSQGFFYTIYLFGVKRLCKYFMSGIIAPR